VDSSSCAGANSDSDSSSYSRSHPTTVLSSLLASIGKRQGFFFTSNAQANRRPYCDTDDSTDSDSNNITQANRNSDVRTDRSTNRRAKLIANSLSIAYADRRADSLTNA
jgi:hypothetical protein